MPTRGDTQINTFVKGLVTDASPLSYPPNTCLDLINFRLNKDGTIFRRLGVDFEDDYLLTATGYSADVLATARKAFYHWPLPNGEALVDIGVVQIGAKFWFLNLYAESPSTAILNGGNAVTAAVDPTSRFSFAVINNYLLVVSNSLPDPYLVSYDYALDSITFETSPVLVRDLWGVDDELDVGERPTTLTPKHYYNLLNQGWSNSIVSTCAPGISAIDCTFITVGVYPSNSDVWTIGRIGDLTSADVQKYDPNIAKRNIFNIGQVPQGHFILPLKSRGGNRQLQTGLTVPLDREIGSIGCVAAYAGRAFYSGILSQIEGGDNRSPLLTGAVLFSQTFEQKIQLVKCYQEADPTSPDISDVLDTDGGIIFIPECSYINHLRAIKESLFVFAVNGIWEIRGGENGFTATSFQVNKVSNVGVYSPDSIVEINGQILFWGVNGIYAITKNQFGIYETNSMTKNVIQKYYDSLPDWARTQAKGYYDLNSNTVRWLFYSDDAKVAGQAIDTQPPAPYVPQLTAGVITTVSPVSRRQPEAVKINDTMFFLMYTDPSQTALYYRIVTVNADLTVSPTAEATIFSGGAGAVQQFHGTYLQDNKIIIAYAGTPSANIRARIINFTGTTPTINAEVLLNTEAQFGLPLGPLRVGRLSSNKALLIFINANNRRQTAQVIDISALDAITFGLTYMDASVNNCEHPRLAVLGASQAIVGTSTSSTNSSGRFTSLTLSGTVVTWGTPITISNVTQIPGSSNRQHFFADVASNTTLNTFGIGGSVVDTLNSHLVMPVTHGVPTTVTPTALQDITTTDYSAAPTTTRAAILHRGNHIIAAVDANRPAGVELALRQYSTTSPPYIQDIIVVETASSVGKSDPELLYLSGDTSVLIYHKSTNDDIQCYPFQSV